MDCCYPLCTNKASETKACRKCYLRIYCSNNCRLLDWESLHKYQCKQHQYTISDFSPVSTKVLGKGTYGEVQLVKHLSTGQFFALKEIKKHTKDRKVPVKMLFQEISVQQTLIHPNIIRLYDYYETTDKVYLFLEYADGCNLYTQLKKKLRLPEREAYHYFSQICQGLKYLHDKNIVHRDLKPDNVLLTKSGNVKICDFGWCAVGDSERSTYCGTLEYMAPEIFEGKKYNNKVDIWALGALLFEILQGQTPFRGKTQNERMKNIKNGNIEFIFNISQAARNLIRRMLAFNPELRPNVDEILDGEWISRYSVDQLTEICLSPKNSSNTEGKLSTKDEFELKLAKNYPSSYKRIIGFSSGGRSTKEKVAMISICNSISAESNSDNSSLHEEKKSIEPSYESYEILKKQKELLRLQRALEGVQSPKSKPKDFFSKIFGVIGLN